MVVYRGVRLMKNSKAYELWLAAQKDHKELAKLDRHMKELDENEKALLKRYK